jgi:NAD(P)-dependent dehydrogenase (short-subunit alcohol dehydrogenase family)
MGDIWMTQTFDAESTTDQVLAGMDLAGRRVFLTGASAGIGVETARALAARGAEVVGAVRDMDKARRVSTGILEAANGGGGAFSLMSLDLGSLASVWDCADRLLADGRPFDAIVANAGLMAASLGKTADGFETDFGTNHLGHFALINRLVPLLRSGSRVVSLTSSGHRFADVDLDDPHFERTPFDLMSAYGRSKTAIILFAVEFDRRHRDRGIRATAVHPGRIATEFGRYMTPDLLKNFPANKDREAGREAGIKTLEQGAATTVWAGFVAPADEVGGRYCENCHVAGIDADPSSRTGVAPYAVDPDRARALWSLSERLVDPTGA